jgi:hypothetical protein
MACATHRIDNRHSRGRVLCFECYRARLDRPEPLPVFVIPFPRLLSERERQHRKRMLSHLTASSTRVSLR